MTEGMQYNVDAGKAALHSLEQLGLFDKIRLLPSFDPEYADRGGILLHILVREHPCQSVSLKGEWSFLVKESGWPDLRTLQPGGSVCVQQRNIAGLDRTVSATVATSNLWQPEVQTHPCTFRMMCTSDLSMCILTWEALKIPTTTLCGWGPSASGS